MSGVLSIGKSLCEWNLSLVGFQNETIENLCSSSSTQRILIFGIFAAATATIYSYKAFQKKKIEKINCDNPYKMAACGNLKGIQQYIASGKNICRTYRETGDTPLTIACEKGHFGIVKEILPKYSKYIDLKTKQHQNALHLACFGRFYNIVDLLLGAKADPNALNEKDQSPLMIAAQKGAVNIVKRLIETGAELNLKDKEGKTALHFAAKEYPQIVKLLLDHGADPDLTDEEGWTPLHVASDAECVDAIHHLLEKTKNANARDKEGYTSLHLTTQTISSRLKSAEALLKSSKVDPNCPNLEGEIALHLAYPSISGTDDLAIFMLKSKRFDLSLKSKNERTGYDIARSIINAGRLDRKDVETYQFLKKVSMSQQTQEKGILPKETKWENGEEITHCDFSHYRNEELKKMRIGNLTLIEWAVVHGKRNLRNALNQKKIFFQFSHENEEKLIREILKIQLSVVVNQLFVPFNIKELRMGKEAIQKFLENPNLKSGEVGEEVQFWMETARCFFRKQEIEDQHKQKGTHRYGSEFVVFDPFILLQLINNELIELLPSKVRATLSTPQFSSFEEFINKSKIPEPLKAIFEKERSLKDLMEFWPVFVNYVKMYGEKL